MRAIKFRGKSMEWNKWVYGHYMFLINSIHQIYEPKENHYYMVDPKTVGQYTGLKDKEGVEIWEGDICRIPKLIVSLAVLEMSDPNPYLRIVKWNNEIGGFAQYKIDGELGMSGWSFCQKGISAYYTVIGNIHDNPELLEGVSEPQKQSDYFPVYGDEGYEEY